MFNKNSIKKKYVYFLPRAEIFSPINNTEFNIDVIAQNAIKIQIQISYNSKPLFSYKMLICGFISVSLKFLSALAVLRFAFGSPFRYFIYNKQIN